MAPDHALHYSWHAVRALLSQPYKCGSVLNRPCPKP